MPTLKLEGSCIAAAVLLSAIVSGCGPGERDRLLDELLARHHGGHHQEAAGEPAPEVDAENPPDPESDAALSRELAARVVLETYCSSCHDTADNVVGDITDTEAMIDRGELQPGQPESSRIYYRTLEGSMPPESVEPRPTAEDVQALHDFIAGLN